MYKANSSIYMNFALTGIMCAVMITNTTISIIYWTIRAHIFICGGG